MWWYTVGQPDWPMPPHPTTTTPRAALPPAPRRPVKLLRFFMVVMFQVFYVCLLNFFAIPLSCQFLSKQPSERNTLADFHGEGASRMSHP